MSITDFAGIIDFKCLVLVLERFCNIKICTTSRKKRFFFQYAIDAKAKKKYFLNFHKIANFDNTSLFDSALQFFAFLF